jgi:hypothetical protein
MLHTVFCIIKIFRMQVWVFRHGQSQITNFNVERRARNHTQSNCFFIFMSGQTCVNGMCPFSFKLCKWRLVFRLHQMNRYFPKPVSSSHCSWIFSGIDTLVTDTQNRPVVLKEGLVQRISHSSHTRNPWPVAQCTLILSRQALDVSTLSTDLVCWCYCSIYSTR